jgi:hypothetical protein
MPSARRSADENPGKLGPGDSSCLWLLVVNHTRSILIGFGSLRILKLRRLSFVDMVTRARRLRACAASNTHAARLQHALLPLLILYMPCFWERHLRERGGGTACILRTLAAGQDVQDVARRDVMFVGRRLVAGQRLPRRRAWLSCPPRTTCACLDSGQQYLILGMFVDLQLCSARVFNIRPASHDFAQPASALLVIDSALSSRIFTMGSQRPAT